MAVWLQTKVLAASDVLLVQAPVMTAYTLLRHCLLTTDLSPQPLLPLPWCGTLPQGADRDCVGSQHVLEDGLWQSTFPQRLELLLMPCLCSSGCSQITQTLFGVLVASVSHG